MNALSKFSVLVLIVLSSFGCASSTRGKVLRNTGLAGAAGAAYGSTRGNYKATHAAMYGASTAALAAKDFDKYLVPVEIGGHKPPLRILRVAQDQEIAWHNSRKFGTISWFLKKLSSPSKKLPR